MNDYTLEHNLILELCKYIDPNKDLIAEYMKHNLHWPYILGQLLSHRVGGMAYYTIKKCGFLAKINREVRNSLKAVYESNIQKNESMKIALDQIGSLLTTSPVPYAFLKGAYLIYLYPTGLRTSNDLDIFVSQDNLSAIEEKLKESGFSQGNIRNGNFVPASRKEIVSSRMNRGETVPFIKQVMLPQMDFLEIDINFSLDFQAKQKNSNVSMLLKNAKPLIKTSFSSLYTLDSIDFIIHLCCHLFKEATVYAWVAMERDLSLYKFVDIYMILYEHTDKLWYDNLALAIKEYGLEKECYYALLHTKELFRIDNRFIENLINNIRPTNLNYLNNIIQPDKGKVYIYKEPFSEWVFMSKKKERLYEITDEIS